MNKYELIKTVGNAILLGKAMCLKKVIPESNDPFVSTLNGANDIMSVIMLKEILESTGLKREDFAEFLPDYNDMEGMFDILDKIHAENGSAE